MHAPELLAAALLLVATPALAQQATFTPAATQPSAGVLSVRPLLAYDAFEGFDDLTATTDLAYGLTPSLAVGAIVPVRYRSDGTFGPADVGVGAKLRVFRNDFGPLDTARAAVLAGVSLPVGDDAFSSDSFDPYLGGAFTLVTGRHGLGLAGTWRFNSGGEDGLGSDRRFGVGPDDAGEALGNYLFRLSPAEFGQATSGGAWYATIEAAGRYEADGSFEALVGPGLLYEGRDVAFELGVRVPAWSDLDGRAELEVSVVAGVRLLF